ncbi:uncharacterized protein MELLADRAFT_70294 [Melampsora larici-populina 98AG31]|uniref:Major facilitator superfamily (MFS) profile domain-containing protein n=1 Tax=Melampsora larici-populina (strain 98AG31 / pathotype 3-4-7) TaxID=747676 RepID=F4SED5_MELLP|nr:uncharacterized protein MELLADRAFT_70294 [Melampsora larici-populina 98AG31]EGF96991.1 hypothetical protein MELLADRAFT_70294 [Melampsora larici-populina 98AG31]
MPKRKQGTYIRHFDEDESACQNEHQNDLNELHYQALERKTVWMLDLTILPIMTMFSLLNFLDRVSIGNLRVIGFQEDLDVSDIQIAIALTAGMMLSKKLIDTSMLPVCLGHRAPVKPRVHEGLSLMICIFWNT